MSARGFVRLAWTALAITVAVILWGAVVRATGSGAGCGSHWPLCNGVVVPVALRTATVIEFAHRATSGAAMLLSLALVIASRIAFPAGHRARTWALASLVFMLLEAAIGAGLVLLGLVEHNTSALRAGYISVHLANTMLLVAAMTGTVWWASQPAGDGSRPIARSRGLLITMSAMVLVAATGSIVALGDTLFPSASLSQGFAADLDSTSHFLIRLRAIHPFLAVAVGLVLIAGTRRDRTFQSDRGRSMRPVVIWLVVGQALLGVMNVLMLAPLPLQMAHLLGSNVLWIAVVWSWMGGQLTVNS